ncbi:hypothetical protein K493DRAFT_267265 [Basidiobolus meristosporus CBS 931.73]|uniref:Cytochrome b561 domain-containing protein n=1 Tax=Basidiobolus meristosporus CBS 931.73 TaxID=1314790 RepID=A0A1Y1XUD9_9FUNG|nr:hypothetical protein K493DRAFT_267265 [Basidiobolus meristosporus CBS 931.73]|eukprot:ORX89295.1 hypothetical protein K493DRAFT_267265 [Basidiobolus meristosporus CBS 931.73]
MAEQASASTPLLGSPGVAESPTRFGWTFSGIQLLLFTFLVGIGGIIANAKWILFSWHPILMSLALVLVSEAVLLLQKTNSQSKPGATIWHRYIMLGGGALGVTGVAVIFINKMLFSKPHFTSWHGRLGLGAVLLILGQIIFGMALHSFPALFGNQGRARKLYKRHRLLGYFILSILWINSLLGTQSDWMVSHFQQSWVWYPVVALILLGLLSRVRLAHLK